MVVGLQRFLKSAAMYMLAISSTVDLFLLCSVVIDPVAA